MITVLYLLDKFLYYCNMKKILLLAIVLSFTYISFSQEKTRVVDRIHVVDSEFISVWHVCEGDFSEQIIRNRNNFPKDAIKLGWDEGYDFKIVL